MPKKTLKHSTKYNRREKSLESSNSSSEEEDAEDDEEDNERDADNESLSDDACSDLETTKLNFICTSNLAKSDCSIKFVNDINSNNIPNNNSTNTTAHVNYKALAQFNSNNISNKLLFENCFDVTQFSRSCVGNSKYLVNAHLNIVSDDDLVFESRFESGNLAKAIKITPVYYELYLRPDLYTNKHTQWFYFRVTKMKKGITYRYLMKSIMYL